MNQEKTFYSRYWKDEHIKVNPFDVRPGEWTEENFVYHMRFFEPYINGSLLDFGCGDGQFLNTVRKYCDSVCGVDLSNSAINKARDQYSEIEFKMIGEDGRLPYRDNHFDTICAIDVLEHILDVESVLEELNRVLKPDGNLLLATSEITPVKMFFISLTSLDKYFYPTSPHIRYFTRNNLRDILRRKGFKPLGYKKNRTYFGFIPKGQMVAAKKVRDLDE